MSNQSKQLNPTSSGKDYCSGMKTKYGLEAKSASQDLKNTERCEDVPHVSKN